uniref:DUF1677 family protein n=1 Tax=Leersia perrieri TaxID=77586 RepID=A0A0D9UXY5_9ORYZ
MAPNGESAVSPAPAARRETKPARRISMEGLQRAMSDLALELTKSSPESAAGADAAKLPAITEQQQQQQAAETEARCECCGMMEECTPGYAARVRERYCGRLVCGLCAAAVSAEAAKTATATATMEEAVAAHMAVCGRFNRVGRANPVLMQTEAMREILRKRSSRSKPNSHGGHGGGLTRSSSCIPAISKDINRAAAATANN